MSNSVSAPYPARTLEGVASILGHTAHGLTNSEIGRLLKASKIRDPLVEAEEADPAVKAGDAYISMNKRERIARALSQHQSRTNAGAALIGFIHAAMNPQRYVANPELFEERRQQLNEVMVFDGLQLNDAGRVVSRTAARTLSEAAQLAGRLTTELSRRQTHEAVLRYCTEEVLAKNNFHAALEACKGVADRIRALSGIDDDGASLFKAALSCRNQTPPIEVIPLTTESDRSEQIGFMNFLIGLFGMYRNTTAHDPKVVRQSMRPVTEAELLELFTTLSLVHHKLDHSQT
jgi:uncharacterized protein (TIGR02391 family)